jgi:hypothetical protein
VMVAIVDSVEPTIKSNAIHKRNKRKSERTETGGEV